MVLSSLVVTLPADPVRCFEALIALGRDLRLTLGEPVRDRVPVVAETADPREGAALAERLAELPGVHVDVVAIDFGEDASA
ncbi:MAG TPA: hypothetical protein VK932_06045 [Kofleriaceae bacterium]|nr:hypothetical protein [Kofleriaceae bacterium]